MITNRRRPALGDTPLANQGFTLIEITITLLITAWIMVMITQVLTGVRKTRDEIHNIQERQLAGPAILQRIERDLRGLFIFNRDSRSQLRVRDLVKDGLDADSLDLVCSEDGLLPHRERSSDPFLRGDVNEVGYRLRERPGSDDFLEIYRREAFGVDKDPFDGGNFSLLHDRVKSFNIEVFTEDGPESEPEETWENGEFVGVPARIEIALAIEMAPRLVREQHVIERRTITYHRIFRFPESLRRTSSLQPIPVVPRYLPPEDPTQAGGGGGLQEPQGDPDPGSSGDPFGPDGGGGTDPDNPFGGNSGDTEASNPFGG